MGTALTGLEIKDTYTGLVKTTDNGAITGSLKKLTDGLGNDSSLSLSTTAASLSGTLAVTGNSTLADLDLSGSTPSLDFVFSPNIAFKHTIIGENYSSSPASSNYMTFKVASGASTQVDVMTLNGVGNVGIGTSAPASILAVSAASPTITLTATTTTATTIGNKNNRLLLLADSTTGGNGGEVVFGTGDTSTGRWAAISGNITANNGTGSAGAIIFATKATAVDASLTERVRILPDGGLTFNGDTAQANALDDYEEGTWTMGLSFGGGTTGITYSSNLGTYTKIGRQVTVNGFLALTSKGSSAGSARITGLPFTIPNSLPFFSSASTWTDQVSFADTINAYGDINSTFVILEQTTNAGVVSTISDLNFTNASRVMVTLTYFV